jgi:peptide chain release factor 2
MKEEIKGVLNILTQKISLIESLLEISVKQARLVDLGLEIEGISDIWNSDKGKILLKEKANLEKVLADFDRIKTDLTDFVELCSISSDEEVVQIEDGVRNLEKLIKISEISAMFKGEADRNDAFLEINSGAGGTESQDWAEMLERMYLRWAASAGYKVELVARQEGEEAGIKSVILKIFGTNAYGYLKHETGIHRLVRNSPFNAQGKRQTSFASVYVTPVVDDTIKIDIQEKDLRIDTYRSSGAGGQHVNTTDSAVRITHIPTGIVAACQNERSQHQNKATAFSMLRSKLFKYEEEKRKNVQNAIEKSDISWGNQIRNYVLQPYKLVKDTRTGLENGNAQAVLDGDIEEFLIEAILKLNS